MPGEDESEKEALDDLFDGGLPSDTLVRYRQDLARDGAYFLCYNWALHRIADDLDKGRTFPEESQMETTSRDAAEMEEELNKVGLVACKDDDPDRVGCLAASLTTL